MLSFVLSFVRLDRGEKIKKEGSRYALNRFCSVIYSSLHFLGKPYQTAFFVVRRVGGNV
jgi:hypothetical protein